jgi:hypothetical protein
MSPQQIRMRILASLSSLLLSHDRSIRVNTPGTLLTLVQGLFSLLSSLAFLSAKSPETKLVKELISNIQSGACGEMIPEALQKEYNVAPAEEDEEHVVMRALVVTGIGRYLEHGAESSRRWVLRYSMEVRSRFFDDRPVFTFCYRNTGLNHQCHLHPCWRPSMSAILAHSVAGF